MFIIYKVYFFDVFLNSFDTNIFTVYCVFLYASQKNVFKIHKNLLEIYEAICTYLISSQKKKETIHIYKTKRISIILELINVF